MSDPLPLDVPALRRAFPALTRIVSGRPAIFADAPGGTQVCEAVIAAMGDYLRHANANLGGAFVTSRETFALVVVARAAVAAFLNAPDPAGIVFGANMSSLTFAFSRALARTWQPGDEVVVTSMDHDANVAPWLLAAEDHGVNVRVCHWSAADGALHIDDLAPLLTSRTRVVALTHASNATGTINDLRPLIAAAHAVGALVYVDAVHLAPHLAIDAQALDCDVLTCSAYKFGGPHVGILAAKVDLLERIAAYKVRPSSPKPPGKWETGTQNFAGIAGLIAALDHIGELGGGGHGRNALTAGMARVAAHERRLSAHFLARCATIPELRIHGVSDPAALDRRTPTFALTSSRWSPQDAAERLGEQGIFTWAGHFYAIGLIEQLGLTDRGGVLRIGFAHYHDLDEVDRVADALTALG